MKDLDHWLRELRRTPGITVERGSRHHKIILDGRFIATVNSSSGGGRGLANAKAIVRRALRGQ